MEQPEYLQDYEPLPIVQMINIAMLAEGSSETDDECYDNFAALLSREKSSFPAPGPVYVSGYVEHAKGEYALVQNVVQLTRLYIGEDDNGNPRFKAICRTSDETTGDTFTITREQKFISFFVTDMQQITGVSGLIEAVDSSPEQEPAQLDPEVLRAYYRDLVQSETYVESDEMGQEALVSNMIDVVSNDYVVHGGLKLQCQYFLMGGEDGFISQVMFPNEVTVAGTTVGLTQDTVLESDIPGIEPIGDKDLMIAIRSSTTDENIGCNEGDILLIPVHQRLDVLADTDGYPTES